jgi:hypothetical protein
MSNTLACAANISNNNNNNNNDKNKLKNNDTLKTDFQLLNMISSQNGHSNPFVSGRHLVQML